MNKLLLTLTGLFLVTTASANEYERYGAVCRLTGTQQTISGAQVSLPYSMSLKVNFATIAADSKTLKTSHRLVAERNFDARSISAALPVTATAVYRPTCEAREVNLALGELDAKNFADLLAGLGAQNVPDLSDALNKGKAALGSLSLGSYCRKGGGYYGRDDINKRLNHDSTGPTLQIHFAPEKWDGLSYHLTLSNCKAIYIDTNGSKHRLGN